MEFTASVEYAELLPEKRTEVANNTNMSLAVNFDTVINSNSCSIMSASLPSKLFKSVLRVNPSASEGTVVLDRTQPGNCIPSESDTSVSNSIVLLHGPILQPSTHAMHSNNTSALFGLQQDQAVNGIPRGQVFMPVLNAQPAPNNLVRALPSAGIDASKILEDINKQNPDSPDVSVCGLKQSSHKVSNVASPNWLKRGSYLQPETMKLPENYLSMTDCSEGNMVRIFPINDLVKLINLLRPKFYANYPDIYKMLFDSKFAKKLKCQLCLKELDSWGKYKVHFNLEHKGFDLLLPCDLCKQYQRPRMDIYIIHWIKHFYNIKCDLCDRKFPSKKALKAHVKSRCGELKKPKCKVCHNRVTSRQMARHMMTHLTADEKNKIKESCAICGMKYLPAFASDHLERFHSSEVFKCSVCDTESKSRKALLCHMRTHRDNQSGIQYDCQHCDATFNQKALHRVHNQRIHGGLKKAFQCDFCEKTFVSMLQLGKHMTLHLDDRLFKCDVCPKSFKVEKYLEVHQLTHKDELQNLCPICGRLIRMEANYYTHLKVHRRRGELPPSEKEK